MKYHQVVDEESNETRVERNQAKNLTFQEDGSDWIGNMLTNKEESNMKITIFYGCRCHFKIEAKM